MRTPASGRIARGIAPWAASAALAFLVSCAAPRTPPDLLLVTIDTLRADRWGCLGDPGSRSPVADRIARGGLLAFEGRAPAPLTLPSHTSMMTGLPPAEHGVHDNGIYALSADGPPTLADALRGAGYATVAFISAYPLARKFGLARGFDFYEEALRGSDDDEGFAQLRERNAGEVVARVRRFFGLRKPDERKPLFAWVHFFDPHAAYRAPAPWPALLANPYDAEVAYVDRQLGELLRLLEDERPGRPRRIVVVSDHGEALGEHGESTHGVLVHTATIRVPLLVRDERYSPRLSGVPVPLECVARTVADLADVKGGLDASAAPPASAFAGAVRAETLYPALNFGWSGQRAWEEDGWRLVVGGRDRLYRLERDPAEREDVAAAHPDVAGRLRARIADDWPEARFDGLLGATAASPEDTEALHALGYLGGGGAPARTPEEMFTHGPDPEERIALLGRINAGITWLDAGRADSAAAALDGVVAADPGNRLAWEYLGRARARSGDAAGARQALRTALAAGPNPVTVYLDLAQVEHVLGDADASWRALEDALRIDPGSVTARMAMAERLLERDEVAGAVRRLEEAADLRPRSAAVHAALARAYATAGRPEEARARWRRVLELEPDGPRAEAARAALSTAGQGG